MVGETPGIGVQLGRMLSGAGREALDLTFNFDVLDTPGKVRWDRYAYDPEYLKLYYRRYLAGIGPADWVAVFLDNHDNPRMLSKIAAGREADPAVRSAVGKLLATIQLTMRGTPFLFQGQELAAVDQRFADVFQLRDVESINRHAALLAAGRTPSSAWDEVLAGSRRPRVLRRRAGRRPRLGVLLAQGPHRAAPAPPGADPRGPDLALPAHEELLRLRPLVGRRGLPRRVQHLGAPAAPPPRPEGRGDAAGDEDP
jgi:hypothetical protein